MKLEGARILITGGCGLIGSTTLDLLLAEHAPAQVILLDDLSRGTRENVAHALEDGRVHLRVGDIREEAVVRAAMDGVDAVLHLAALRITACAAEPRRAFEVMGQGSFNVVAAAHEAKIKRLVAASTASIYGAAGAFPTGEEHAPYNNRTWYGAMKLMLEGLLRSFNDMYGLPYLALRYFNVYGPRMDVHGRYTEVMIRWLQQLEQGQAPAIFGDGSQTMDFIHVRDVARANLLALCSERSDAAYNVASGTETSLLELLNTLGRVMGKKDVAPRFEPARAVNPVPRRLADTRAARAELGFEARITLEEGLADLVGWWRNQPRVDAA